MREGEQQREDAAAVVYGFPAARHAAPAPSFALAERVAASGIFVDVRNLIQRAAGDEGRVTAPAAFQRAWEEMRCSYLHELKPAFQGLPRDQWTQALFSAALARLRSAAMVGRRGEMAQAAYALQVLWATQPLGQARQRRLPAYASPAELEALQVLLDTEAGEADATKGYQGWDALRVQEESLLPAALCVQKLLGADMILAGAVAPAERMPPQTIGREETAAAQAMEALRGVGGEREAATEAVEAEKNYGAAIEAAMRAADDAGAPMHRIARSGGEATALQSAVEQSAREGRESLQHMQSAAYDRSRAALDRGWATRANKAPARVPVTASPPRRAPQPLPWVQQERQKEKEKEKETHRRRGRKRGGSSAGVSAPRAPPAASVRGGRSEAAAIAAAATIEAEAAAMAEDDLAALGGGDEEQDGFELLDED